MELFRRAVGTVAEPTGGASRSIELQLLFEKNLEALPGVRFLAPEFVTERADRCDGVGALDAMSGLRNREGGPYAG